MVSLFFLEFKSFDVTYFNSMFFSLPPKTYFTLTVPASGLIFITCPTPPGLLIPGQVRDCTTTISFNRYGKFSFVVVDIFVVVVFEKLVDFVEAPSLFVTNVPLLALFSFLVVVVLDKNDEPGDGASDNICCLFCDVVGDICCCFGKVEEEELAFAFFFVLSSFFLNFGERYEDLRLRGVVFNILLPFTNFISTFFSVPPRIYFTLIVLLSLTFTIRPVPPGLLMPGHVRDCTFTIEPTCMMMIFFPNDRNNIQNIIL